MNALRELMKEDESSFSQHRKVTLKRRKENISLKNGKEEIIPTERISRKEEELICGGKRRHVDSALKKKRAGLKKYPRQENEAQGRKQFWLQMKKKGKCGLKGKKSFLHKEENLI